jgi:hypothetical protein
MLIDAWKQPSPFMTWHIPFFVSLRGLPDLAEIRYSILALLITSVLGACARIDWV